MISYCEAFCGVRLLKEVEFVTSVFETGGGSGAFEFDFLTDVRGFP